MSGRLFSNRKTAGTTPAGIIACREHYLYGRQILQDMQFYEYAEQWYRLKKEPFISPASWASYRSMFMKHLLPNFGLQKMGPILQPFMVMRKMLRAKRSPLPSLLPDQRSDRRSTFSNKPVLSASIASLMPAAFVPSRTILS